MPDSQQSTPQSLQLDDRSLQHLLQQMQRYAQAIPFGPQQGWHQVLFPVQGADPASLAALADGRTPAAGDLLAHQALMLAFYRMLDTPRALFNAFPEQHRLLYYRQRLGLSERATQPDRAMVSFVLAPECSELALVAGMSLDGGQDANGASLHYRLETSLLANRGRLSSLCWAAADGTRQVLLDLDAGLALPAGGARLFHSDDRTLAVRAGIALASPALAVRHGKRHHAKLSFDAVPGILGQARLSAATGWHDLPFEADGSAIVCRLDGTLPGAADGLDGYPDPVPVLELCEGPEVALTATPVSLEVTAEDAHDIAFATDDGAAQLASASYPFGAEPSLQSGFTLASRDWIGQQRVAVTVTFDWMDLPAGSFAAWYAGYDAPPVNDNEFKVSIVLWQDGEATTLPTSQPLFADNAVAGTAPKGRAIGFEIATPVQAVWNEGASHPREQSFFVEVRLAGKDFLHRDYALSLAAGVAVNAPYTPHCRSIRVDYDVTDDGFATPYVLSPFGHQAAADPALTGHQLYCGLDGLQPGQDIDLHWQVQGPSAQQLQWQYLGLDNNWHDLQDSVRDGTSGLFDDGLWHAVLPSDAAGDAAAMPAGRHWLRALVAPHDDGLTSRLMAVHANAAMAVLDQPDEVDPGHLTAGLPAFAIGRAVEVIDGLASVLQPLPSAGGRPRESQAQFLQRVAQRLSHRNRAVTWRDIGQLLREHFPEIGQLRLPDGNLRRQYSDPLPVVVLPLPARRDNDDALRPQFSAARLQRMKDAIAGLSSAWLELTIQNAVYTNVAVRWALAFEAGINADYGYRRVTQAVQRHYMPWTDPAQDDGSLTLGERIDYYDMVTLIQRQSEVSHLISLTLDGQPASKVAAPGEVLVLDIDIAAPAVPATKSRARRKP